MHCPSCNKNVEPYQEMGASRQMINMCPMEGCHAAIPTMAPTSPLPTVEAEIALRREYLGPPSSVPTLPPAKNGSNLLASAKDRLAAVQLELQRFAALQAEEAMLERMIAAAGEVTGDAN